MKGVDPREAQRGRLRGRPGPATSGLFSIPDRQEDKGQRRKSQGKLWHFTSLYPYRSLWAWFRSLLGEKKGKKRGYSAFAHTEPLRAERRAGCLTLFWGQGEGAPHRVPCPIEAMPQGTVGTDAGHSGWSKDSRLNGLKTYCQVPQAGESSGKAPQIVHSLSQPLSGR